MTVSRATEDNGVVGYFDLPSDAEIYKRGLITVNTVGGDAFVQLDDFIATDNVIICTPLAPLRLTTLIFISFAVNYQKWRYSYGRQCYREKLAKVNIYLPVMGSNKIDETLMENVVKQSSYWRQIEKRFKGHTIPVFQSKSKSMLPGF